MNGIDKAYTNMQIINFAKEKGFEPVNLPSRPDVTRKQIYYFFSDKATGDLESLRQINSDVDSIYLKNTTDVDLTQKRKNLRGKVHFIYNSDSGFGAKDIARRYPTAYVYQKVLETK